MTNPSASRTTIVLTTPQRTILAQVSECAERLGTPVYLVGGAVRDMLVTGSLYDQDYDFLVDGDAATLARAVSQEVGGELKVFASFFTAKLISPRVPGLSELDFAQARTEQYEAFGKLPQVVPATITEDLKRRDFTINTLAVRVTDLLALLGTKEQIEVSDLQSKLIDPYDGLADLRASVLRVLHDKSFLEDPTRLYRAARYAARFGLRFTAETAQLATSAVDAQALHTISLQRTINEFKKIFLEQSVAPLMELLTEWKLWPTHYCSSFERMAFRATIGALAELPEQHRSLRYEAFLCLVRDALSEEKRILWDQASGFNKKKLTLLYQEFFQARSTAPVEELSYLALALRWAEQREVAVLSRLAT